MPPLSVLIKPASSLCNMNCSYCFYRDEAENRANASYGIMSFDTLEAVVSGATDFAKHTCTFMFQGGEPTLAGIDFYIKLLELEKKYKKPSLKIFNCIQTNGFGIDEQWAEFFAQNGFLVGISLDGPAEIHNLNRKSGSQGETFNRVMKTVSLFNRYNTEYNILSVVTCRSARSAEKIYNFFRKQNFKYLQFIPCLEPIGKERGKEKYSLSPAEYEDFFVRIFDLWLNDLRRGNYISIRHIDNWLSIITGNRPEACSMTGICSVQYVVEADGGVYPCDFYVLDDYRLGNARADSFGDMLSSETAKRFIEKSIYVPEECKSCRYYSLCRNGCRRERAENADGSFGKYYYCSAIKGFFDKRCSQLEEAALILRNM